MKRKGSCMRRILANCAALALWASPLAALAEDINLRVESAIESLQKAQTEAALKIDERERERLKKLEGRLAEIKKWTTAQFELGERGEIDKPKVMGHYLRRWQEIHERELYTILQFPDRSKGAIESGRALNTLLSRVGPAANQNLQTRRLDPERGLPLHEATANEQVTEQMFHRLIVRDKLLGARDSRHGNADPIDIDWPALLRDKRWDTHRAAVEKARQRVLDEMARTEGITPAADEELRDAIAALNADFRAYRQEWVKQDHEPGTKSLEYHRIWQSNKHIQKLIASAYFVVEAKTIADLPQRETFRGGNVEELLSYMTRNNLEFGPPSKDTDKNAYHQVFNLMTRYYLDQHAMTRLQQQLEEEIDESKSISRDAVNVALGKTMSANYRAALSIAELQFLDNLFDD